MKQRDLTPDETFCYFCSAICRKPSKDSNGYLRDIPKCPACALAYARRETQVIF